MQKMEYNTSLTPVSDHPLPSVSPPVAEDKTISPRDHIKPALPAIPASELKPGSVVVDDIPELHTGFYRERPVTRVRVASSTLARHRAALIDFMQSASPFWLPVVGVC